MPQHKAGAQIDQQGLFPTIRQSAARASQALEKVRTEPRRVAQTGAYSRVQNAGPPPPPPSLHWPELTTR